MNAKEPMEQFLLGLGCKRRKHDVYVLDEFDHEFYLIFDMSWDEEMGDDRIGTVDILIGKPGLLPSEPIARLVADCRELQVARFMLALGLERFSAKTLAHLGEYLRGTSPALEHDGGMGMP